jgi:hypothetical protein
MNHNRDLKQITTLKFRGTARGWINQLNNLCKYYVYLSPSNKRLKAVFLS